MSQQPILIQIDPTGSIFDSSALLASAPPIAGRPGSEGAAGTAQQPAGTTGQGGQQGAQQPQSPFGGTGFLLMLFGFLVLMILMSTMSARKEKRRRQEMYASLARHDRVQTTGGIIGTIAELRDDEVILKVDESTNTRIHFSRAAIQSVLKKAGGGGSAVETDQMQPETVNAS